MAKVNKTQLVLKHLKEKGNITSWEAIQKYGATRLSAIILSMLLLSGCEMTEVESVNENNKDTSMFVIIENTGTWSVVYHKETKVMYVVSCGAYNAGTFTVLVDADGKPMLWED